LRCVRHRAITWSYHSSVARPRIIDSNHDQRLHRFPGDQVPQGFVDVPLILTRPRCANGQKDPAHQKGRARVTLRGRFITGVAGREPHAQKTLVAVYLAFKRNHLKRPGDRALACLRRTSALSSRSLVNSRTSTLTNTIRRRSWVASRTTCPFAKLSLNNIEHYIGCCHRVGRWAQPINEKII